jgi:hypothetical protein
MTVYIHPPIDYGRDYNALTRRLGGLWSHMATDGDLSELLTFARKIGVSSSWLQGRPGEPWHFDLTPSKYQAALNAGARNLDRREYVELMSAGKLTRRPRRATV